MKNANIDISGIIRELIDVLRREADAVASRNLGALSRLIDRKESLADQLAMALDRRSGVVDDGLLAPLAAMQALAAANAARIRLLRDGAARARARIESLTASAREIGAYSAQGGLLRIRAAGATEREA